MKDMLCSSFGVGQADSSFSVDEPLSLSDSSQLCSSYPDHAYDALDSAGSEGQEDPSYSPLEACNGVSDVFLDLSSYCFAKIERLQEELTSTRGCLDAADSQLEDARKELSAALHDLEHQKRMREHQQHVMDRILDSKLALETKLNELESLLNTDMDMYVRFRQQTTQCILAFEGEIQSLRSELFEAKQDNIFCRWKNLILSDEIAHLTAMNSLLRQKIAALESQAADHDTQHSVLEAHKAEEVKCCRSAITALEKQCFYFKSKYTETERLYAKAQLDLTVMRSIMEGKDAEIRKLTERLQSSTVKAGWMQADDKKKVHIAASDALVQLEVSKELLAKVLNK